MKTTVLSTWAMWNVFLCLTSLLTLGRVTASPPFATLHTFGAYADGTKPGVYASLLKASDGNLYGTTYLGGTNSLGTVYRVTPAGVLTTLHSFTDGGVPSDGAYPVTQVTEAKDGFLYGTCQQRGDGGGTLWKIKKDGTGFKVVYTFENTGFSPSTPLVQDAAGILYGACQYGGSNGKGVLFRVNTDGTNFGIVHDFAVANSNEDWPALSLLISGTTLYGTTPYGGADGFGVIYKVATDGTNYKTLPLDTGKAIGGKGISGLMLSKDGKLYGVTHFGGTHGRGNVFSIHTDGTGYADRYDFTANEDGAAPEGNPVQDSNGILYGIAKQGGLPENGSVPAGNGTVWTLHSDGTGFAVLHPFAQDGSEGTSNDAALSLVLGASNKLYGVRQEGSGPHNVGFLYSLATDGSGFQTLFDFSKGFVDGAAPLYAALIIGPGSDFYGTTSYGGASEKGTAFRMTPTGKVTILHGFSGSASLEDGATPYASLLVGPSNTLLGTTFGGGTYGQGTVFSVGADGTGFNTLLSFGTAAGANLPSGLVRASDGNLYGTSYSGGRYNNGCVYRVGTDGLESVIYSFKNDTDGKKPFGGLLVGLDGALYGTTLEGGAGSYGTIYRLTTARVFTLLHAFKSDGSEGANPYGTLAEDADGFLYGTTSYAGAYTYGTLYTIKADGSGFKTLHTFSGQSDGGLPEAGLLLASDGRLYGTASAYGLLHGSQTNADGTVFRLNTSGSSFSVLHTFDTATEGYAPYSSVTEGVDGNLYGTTMVGGIAPYPGTLINGTAYRVSTLLPLVSGFTPTSGKAGTSVTITGVNFTGATSVKFGAGTTTAFTINSDTQITTTVPRSATTGSISVTTPQGIGSSQNMFTRL